MTEPTDPQRLQILAELSELGVQRSEALEDATFMGWGPAESALYEQRLERTALLRRLLG
jgi:hypothetical protein